MMSSSDPNSVPATADIAIIGASAAGLAAAIFAAETASTVGIKLRIIALEGAHKPGAKILISGGGRCNVTNEQITSQDYDGGSQPTIRNVLRAFDEQRTIEWMRSLGVELKLEPNGKYFPTNNKARTVLDGLLERVRQLGIQLRTSTRVTGIRPLHPGVPSQKFIAILQEAFELGRHAKPVNELMGHHTSVPNQKFLSGLRAEDELSSAHRTEYELTVDQTSASAESSVEAEPLFEISIQNSSPIYARRVIMATGGMALPKSGSDGAGLNWMRQLGHTIVPTTPALAPLLLSEEAPGPGAKFAEFAGITLPLRLILVNDTGKHLARRTGSVVFTHFGISGPAALDISRHIARHTLQNPGPARVLLGHPDLPTSEAADEWLQQHIKTSPRRSVANAISAIYPERIASALASGLGEKLNDLTRAERLELARRLAALPLTVIGNRGYSFAETTAGGVNLGEIDARTMQSRRIPAMYLCGEILDVDGRIGGFNFQWAWSTGYLAGRAAVESLTRR
ncbi:MAG: NAD(P)/FAD-dependent oxidoreductase [Candidatus Sumerlaeaceae bacterium]